MYIINELQLDDFEHTPSARPRDIYMMLGKHTARPDFQTSDAMEFLPIESNSMSAAELVSRENRDGVHVILNAIETFEKQNLTDFSDLKKHIKETL